MVYGSGGVLQSVDVGLFADYPHHIALLETPSGTDKGKVALALLDTHDHTTIMVADTTLHDGLADERAIGSNDELMEPHLTLLYLRIFLYEFITHGRGKLLHLLIIANDLYTVAREYHVVSARDIDALSTTKNTADVYAEALTDAQLLKGLSCPR